MIMRIQNLVKLCLSTSLDIEQKNNFLHQSRAVTLLQICKKNDPLQYKHRSCQ